MDAKKRSTLLTLAAIVAGYAVLRNVPAFLPENLQLEPLDSPVGFRQYVAGETSGGFDPFVGLGSREVLLLAAALETDLRSVC